MQNPPCTPHLNVFGLRICDTADAGRSLFASKPIPSNTVIEISPVLLFSSQEYSQHGKYTILDSYTFVWERSSEGSTMALALGLGSLFNHTSFNANVSYELDKKTNSIKYRTVRDIKQGEELLICYGAGSMWWEPCEQEKSPIPTSEADECALFGNLVISDECDTHSRRAPVGIDYKASLWRVTASPDPKRMKLETRRAWAVDVPPKACSTIVKSLQSLVKDGTLRAGDAHPRYSIRHLRSFRKTKEVKKYTKDAIELCTTESEDLSMLVALESAHERDELVSLLKETFAHMDVDWNLYLVDVPTGPAPVRERLSEWCAVWPCMFLPPGAGFSSKSSIPGSDAARAIVPVDRSADEKLWEDKEMIRFIRLAFEKCLSTASKAQEQGELGVGVFVTTLPSDADDASLEVEVTAHDTRTSTNHPLRHAIPNAVRLVADLRAQKHNDSPINTTNGKDYLLTGMSLFITHEPCVYCAMALVHSRVKRVFFLYPSPGTGGFCGVCNDGQPICHGMQDGGPFAIHEQSGLNHKYEVWRWIDPAIFDERSISASLSYEP